MLYPKTGELQTYWTNYHCTDEDCPGKGREGTHKVYPMSHVEIPVRSDDTTRDGPTDMDYAPSRYWDPAPSTGAEWDDPS